MNRRPQLAFTLIELLLALMIAVVVVVLLTSLFRTTSRTVADQRERLAGAPLAMEALAQIHDDLMRAFIPDKDESCAVSLKANPAALAFCTLRPSASDTDLRWSRAVHVEYRTEPQAGALLRLVRIEHPLTGPDSGGAVTSSVLDAIDGFAAELYDGSEWHKEWPPQDASPSPRAARIEIVAGRIKAQQAWRTEIFIPAGTVVTSSVVRTATR